MDLPDSLNRLKIISHRHQYCEHFRHTCSPESHLPSNKRDQRELSGISMLHFSILNILRPEFGRKAILLKAMSMQVTPLPTHSKLLVPQDLSFSTDQLLPRSQSSSFNKRENRDNFYSHCNFTLPVQRHMSSLSRSGSLDSLASNLSSVTGGSINGISPVSSSTSITITESISGDSHVSNNLPVQSSDNRQSLWPAWIYCTRYSDRPSSGPRTRRIKRSKIEKLIPTTPEEKRPRTAFSAEQLNKLKLEFKENRYLTEFRRQKISQELGLNEQQIKIWFQNKRAKIKKASGQKNPLALQLMAQGLYNHSTMSIDEVNERAY